MQVGATPVSDKTWAAWQIKNRKANLECQRLLKANPNSFSVANNVNGNNLKADHAARKKSLTNIANAATNISTLMAQIMTQLTPLGTRMDTLKRGQPMPALPAPTTAKGQSKTPKFVPCVYTQAEALAIFDPNSYCSLHKWRVHATHISLTCKKQGKNHKTAAMRANILGGSNNNKGWETNPNPL